MGRAFAFLDRGPYAAWGNVGALGLRSGVALAGTESSGRYGGPGAGYRFVTAEFGLPLGRRSVTFDLNYTRDSRSGVYYRSNQHASNNPFEESIGVAGAVGLADWLSVGVGYKRLRVDERGSANCCSGAFQGAAHAFDVGLYVATPSRDANAVAGPGDAGSGWFGGVSLHNIGPDFEVRDGQGRVSRPGTRRQLPTTLRVAVGSAWGLSSPMPAVNHRAEAGSTPKSRVSVGVAMEKGLTDHEIDPYADFAESALEQDQVVFSGGAEASVGGVIALRVGYIYGDTRNEDGLTAGAGLSWGQRFGFDISESSAGTDSRPKYALWLNWPWSGER